MCVNSNYNVVNCYSNSKIKQNGIGTKSSPAFKMAESPSKAAPVEAPLAAAYFGILNVKNLGSVNKCILPPSMPQKSGQMKDVTVKIAGGDMTQIKADAYLVPEFNSCASEGGVGGAIARRGGAKGLKDYNKYIEEKGEELDRGDIVVTNSGGGNSKYLLHAVTAGADKENSFEVVRDATYNALKTAQAADMKSVVIPAIGTGIIGTLTNTESANAILSGINQFAEEGGKMDVSVVVYSTGQGFNDFSNALTTKSYETATPAVGTKKFDAGTFVKEMNETLSNPPPETSSEKQEEMTLSKVKEYLKDRTNFENVKNVNYIVKKHPEIVDRLLKIKDSDGSQYFKDEYDVLYEVADKQANVLLNNPEKVFAVLENPEELSALRTKNEYFENGYMFDGGKLNWAIKHPLNSTREANPGLFEPETKINVASIAKAIMDMDADNNFKLAGFKVLYSHPEWAEKLGALKDSSGHQYFDSETIGSFMANFEPNADNPEYIDRLNKFMKNPSIASGVEGYMNRGIGLWRHTVDY